MADWDSMEFDGGVEDEAVVGSNGSNAQNRIQGYVRPQVQQVQQPQPTIQPQPSTALAIQASPFPDLRHPLTMVQALDPVDPSVIARMSAPPWRHMDQPIETRVMAAEMFCEQMLATPFKSEMTNAMHADALGFLEQARYEVAMAQPQASPMGMGAIPGKSMFGTALVAGALGIGAIFAYSGYKRGWYGKAWRWLMGEEGGEVEWPPVGSVPEGEESE